MALLEFYGEGCPHCKVMAPIVEKLSAELSLEVDKYEVWDNAENAAKMKEYDTGLCGGVPFFFNTESKKFLCGASTESELKDWMQGK